MKFQLSDFNEDNLTPYSTPINRQGKHVNACEFLNGLYLHFMKIGDFESALQCAKEAYKLNPKFAMLVGALVERGVIVNTAPFNHVHYYYTAAMYLEPQAYNSLGKCFLFGNGVCRDLMRAQLYFSIGCNYQIGESAYYLGYLHQNIFFLPGCFDIAFRYYAQAHVLGCALGTNALAICYTFGIGTRVNEFEALELYHDACFRGKITECNSELRRLEYFISPSRFNDYLRTNHTVLVTRLFEHTTIFKPCSENVYMLIHIRETLLNLSKVLQPSESIDDFLRQAYNTVISL